MQPEQHYDGGHYRQAAAVAASAATTVRDKAAKHMQSGMT
jgi:hypothetical protein